MKPSTASISSEQLKHLLDVSRMFAVTTELEPLLKGIAESCCAMLACERASIFLHDPSKDQLWTKIALGSKEIRVPSGAGIVGHVFKSNQVLHVPKPYDDPRFNPEPDRKSGFVTRNLLTAPMVDLNRSPVGVIQAVNKTGDDFSPSDEAMIQLLADQAGVAIQRFRLQQAAMEGVALRREMDLAKQVQEALIPREPPQIAGIESLGWTLPASITGGDCFDLWRLPDGRLGMFLGDATGHGIGPAMVVSQTRTLIRALCEIESDPHKLLALVNARLNADLEPGKFVTCFLAMLSSDGTLQWSSGGHGPLFVRRGGGQPFEELEAPGPPLGIMPEFLADPTTPYKLEPGGLIAVLSDGFFEAFAPNGSLFGAERVLEILRDTSLVDTAALIDRLRRDVERFQEKLEPNDDQTVILARRL